MTLTSLCHCEPPQAAWQSPAELLRKQGGRCLADARHDINRSLSLRAAARRRGNLPQSCCESRAGDVSLTLDMTLTSLCHCEPPSGGVAIPRKAVVKAGRETPRFARGDINRFTSLRAAAGGVAIPRVAVVKAWREMSRFARHDINQSLSLRAAARRRGNLPQSCCESRAGDPSLRSG
ncbi:MAG: hypothetical protein KatS3mg045_0362 [Bellilinea sp.]|nr:MAG: hypothetical protein KatS3mg045_0362 [Bellilinea sp.]